MIDWLLDCSTFCFCRFRRFNSVELIDCWCRCWIQRINEIYVRIFQTKINFFGGNMPNMNEIRSHHANETWKSVGLLVKWENVVTKWTRINFCFTKVNGNDMWRENQAWRARVHFQCLLRLDALAPAWLAYIGHCTIAFIIVFALLLSFGLLANTFGIVRGENYVCFATLSGDVDCSRFAKITRNGKYWIVISGTFHQFS